MKLGEQIDTRWFQERLADKHLSQRKLAHFMDLDPAAMSLMIRGKRKMSAQEAAEIASFLGVTTDEVLARAGAAPTMVTKEMVQKLSKWKKGSDDKAADATKVWLKLNSEALAGSIDQDGGRPFLAQINRSKAAKAAPAPSPAPVRASTTTPDLLELPVPMSDGSVAHLSLPKVLTKSDAERIAAMVMAFAGS